MPIGTAAAAALISGGGNLAGGLANSISTGIQNRKSRQWSEKMYQRQHDDNIKFWESQNDYNNPTNQMARLKEAGLNPALIYGSSSSGASGQAGSIKSPDVQQAQFRTPEWGNAIYNGANTINQIYDLKIKQAQIDNLKADNTVKYTRAQLLASQGKRSDFDLGLEKKLETISATARAEGLRKLEIDNQYTLDKNAREGLTNSANLAESAARLKKIASETSRTKAEKKRIDQQIDNLRKDGTLKALEIELRSAGINPNSPFYLQLMGRLLNSGAGMEENVRNLLKALSQ